VTERLELRPEGVSVLLATPTNTMPPTAALARDWIRLSRMVRQEHGLRLANLEMGRPVVEEMVETTKRYISMCDAREHFGGGDPEPLRVTHERLQEMEGAHRLELARDWLRLHKVLTRTPASDGDLRREKPV